jgi:TRAP-type C4-dicarboxylate transport system permease small subunit
MDRRKKFSPLRWIDGISEAAGYASGALIVLSTLVICYGVVLRAFGESTIWQTELTIYLLMFVTFVGGAYGLKHGEHVNVDVLANRMPERGRLVLNLVVSLLCLIFVVVMAWKAYESWTVATQLDWSSGTAWNPSLKYPYAILPLGMALIALQYVAIMVRDFRSLVYGGDKSEEQGSDKVKEGAGL